MILVWDFPIKQTFRWTKTRAIIRYNMSSILPTRRLFSLHPSKGFVVRLNLSTPIDPFLLFNHIYQRHWKVEKWSHFIVLVTKTMKNSVIQSTREARYTSMRTFEQPAQWNYMFCWFEWRPPFHIFKRIR